MDSYNDLSRDVDGDGGLVTTTMEQLREIHGAGRLGKHVRDAISQQLAAHGLGHLPVELPSYQENEVRVYRLGSPIGKVIDAVQKPNSGGDAVLRGVGGDTSADVLAKVRELVCE